MNDVIALGVIWMLIRLARGALASRSRVSPAQDLYARRLRDGCWR